MHNILESRHLFSFFRFHLIDLVKICAGCSVVVLVFSWNSVQEFPLNLRNKNCSTKQNTIEEELFYTHPEHPEIKGRPFSGIKTKKAKTVFEKYLNSAEIGFEAISNLGLPQPVTAISANHFLEHRQSIESFWKLWPEDTKVLIYNLGDLKRDQIEFLNNSTRKYIYREYNYDSYPEHCKWLDNMCFKLMIVSECLTEFRACLWMDSSIVMTESPEKLVDDFVISRKSSFVYYVHPTKHSTAWATHPIMFSYLPSNISKFNNLDFYDADSSQNSPFYMSQAGAIILYNTHDLKHGIFKYALACALTSECLMPSYELDAKVDYHIGQKHPN